VDAFRDSVRRLQRKALDRGILPVPTTGDPVQDAMRRRESAREIERGRPPLGDVEAEGG
jgi:hypothetical protein